METSSPMPVLYIAHGGGPCFFMEWTVGPRDTWDGMKSWLANIPSTLPFRPKAIVVISAHWEEPQIAVINSETSTLLYDYYGFPEETYRLEYKAPTAPEVASRIGKLFEANNIPFRYETERGLDHGVFIPLKVIYPDADIPIVQVALLHR
jgi:aromatic ring-opening dioxygenase catalytic subunit (LigB family)